MAEITREDKKYAFISYVLYYLGENLESIKDVIGEFSSIHTFIESRKNFFSVIEKLQGVDRFSLDSKSHNFYRALNRKTSNPLKETIDNITKAFQLPLNYGQVVNKLVQKDPLFISFLPKTKNRQKQEIKENTNILKKVPNRIKPSDNADYFYNGYAPKWADLAAHFDFDRNIYLQPYGIKNSIENEIAQLNKIKFLIIRGVAGTGKTTLLKRICFDLAKDYQNVYYFDLSEATIAGLDTIHHEILSLLNKVNGKIIIGINGLYDLIRPIDHLQVKTLIDSFYKRQLLFLFAESNAKFNGLKAQGKLMNEDMLTDFEIPALDDNEVDALMNKISLLEDKGYLTPIPRVLPIEEIKELCKNKFEKHLIVALLQLRHGKRFKDIILDECTDLEKIDNSNFIFETYKITCLFSVLSMNIIDEVLFTALGKEYFEASRTLQKYCYPSSKKKSSAGIIENRDNVLYARHPFIAKEVFTLYYENNSTAIVETFIRIFAQENCDINTQRFTQFLEKNVFKNINIGFKLYGYLEEDINNVRKIFALLFQFSTLNRRIGLSYYYSYGKFEDNLRNFDSAIKHYDNALRIKPEFGPIIFSLSWCHLHLKNWDESAAYAKLAYKYSRNDVDKLNAAELLSLNNVEHFIKAKGMFNELLKSLKKEIKAEAQQYFTILNEVEKIKMTYSAEEFNSYILKRKRPRLKNLKTYLLLLSSENDDIKNLLSDEKYTSQLDFEELKIIKVRIEKINDPFVQSQFYKLLASQVQ